MSKQYKYRERWTHEGKRIEVRANSKAELRDKVAKKKIALEKGQTLIESSMRVSAWVDVCYSKYKNTKQITLDREKQKADKWIKQSIGNMPLKAVKPLHLQNVLNELTGYSAAFIQDISRIMKWCFGLAVENGLINNNPADKVTKPQGTKNKRREITDIERRHILKAADDDISLRYFLPMLFCGLRPSECQALKGKDIDRRAAELTVQGTKTDKAYRIIPIPKYLLERLPAVADDELVFKTVSGMRIDENGNRRLWNRMRRAANVSMGARLYRNELIPAEGQSELPFDQSVTPYHLRHTFCCDCVKAGLPMTTTQYLMGHSSINLIAEVYYHMDAESRNKASELLEKRAQIYTNIVPIRAINDQKLRPKGETNGETTAVTVENA